MAFVGTIDKGLIWVTKSVYGSVWGVLTPWEIKPLVHERLMSNYPIAVGQFL